MGQSTGDVKVLLGTIGKRSMFREFFQEERSSFSEFHRHIGVIRECSFEIHKSIVDLESEGEGVSTRELSTRPERCGPKDDRSQNLLICDLDW